MTLTEIRHQYYLKNKERWRKWKDLSVDKQQELLEYQREYRKKNRTSITATQILNRQKKQQELINMLGGRCNRCHGIFLPSVYDFHHRDPKEKEFSIGSLLSSKSIETLRKEAEKCELLCANCHRIAHATNTL